MKREEKTFAQFFHHPSSFLFRKTPRTEHQRKTLENGDMFTSFFSQVLSANCRRIIFNTDQVLLFVALLMVGFFFINLVKSNSKISFWPLYKS